jgi:phage tail sheath protein FI
MPYLQTVNQSANVYTREIDLTSRTVGASTSIGAIVGAATRGPIGEPTLVTSTREFVEAFGIPDPTLSRMHYCALAFLIQSSRLYVVRVDTQALTAGAYATVDDPEAELPNTPGLSLDCFNDLSGDPVGIYSPMTTLGFIESTPGVENQLFFVCAINPGEWNNNLYIKVFPSNPKGYAPGVLHDPTIFIIEVYENYTGVYNAPLEKFTVCRERRVDGYGNALYIEDVINSRSNYIRVRNNAFSSPTIPILDTSFVFLQGGTNGNVATDSDIMLGWDLFSDPENITVNILINGGYASPDVHLKMDEIASKRMDSIAILDVPSDLQQVDDAINYRLNTLNLNSSYSALYLPDVLVYDRYNDMSLFVPISGHAAASLALTDRVAATWFAPAGIKRGLLAVDGLRETYSLPKRDALNDAQINMVRVLPKGAGIALWSQATLYAIPSATQNINIRRLMNYLEKSVSASLVPALFDPNDSTLRNSLVAQVSSFLEPIKQGRGLAAYAVICNSSNNPSYIIANGDLIMDVIVDAESVLPAKRILFRATINKKGASFSAQS